MKRRLLAGLLLLSLSCPAVARTVEERLIAGLKSQGYVILEDGFTWLGRLRIVAESAMYHREIVVNPETGEILRDYVVLMSDFAAPLQAPAIASAEGGHDRSSTLASSDRDGTSSPGGGPSDGQGMMGDPAPPVDVGKDDLLPPEPVLPVGTEVP